MPRRRKSKIAIKNKNKSRIDISIDLSRNKNAQPQSKRLQRGLMLGPMGRGLYSAGGSSTTIVNNHMPSMPSDNLNGHYAREIILKGLQEEARTLKMENHVHVHDLIQKASQEIAKSFKSQSDPGYSNFPSSYGSSSSSSSSGGPSRPDNLM
ncbi:hypothetical protein TSOC_004215 [Tetrabaena socialis]|uniref:Uncharacterized protein n=1 Tax=Tetrabaena socialis TaxID=47790 RepID=A0A2J8A9I5_9CHLO|nr:hypothetical protein TSOC_004215 [Tetrabaena socialis]|eukprot:PNH09170.1 hypothetical protein TSOC_004215 [Tetrabaena socialis]